MSASVDRKLQASLLAIFVALTTSFASADDDCSVWLIKTRYASSENLCAGGSCVKFFRREEKRWQTASRNAFVTAPDANQPTIFFIHGSGWEAATAESAGLRAMRALTGGFSYRFVIWSWPTETDRGALENLRSDFYRSHPEGVYFGSVLQDIAPEVPVTLVAHSMGARVVASGLHTYATAVAEADTAAAADGYKRHNVVFLAAALDDGDFARGCLYGNALDVVDELHNIYNPCDAALKRYRFLEKGGRAVGYMGLWVGRNRVALRQVNVSGLLGKRHRWRYYEAANVLARYGRSAVKLYETPEADAAEVEPVLAATTESSTDG